MKNKRFEPKEGEPWYLTRARHRSYVFKIQENEVNKVETKKWYEFWKWRK